MTVDAITISVVKGALESICDEMDTLLIHAALSPIISETNDCAHGIYHPVTGETIAQGRIGLPVFMANMQFTVQAVLDKANRSGGMRPGDVWITNDPYLGGTHLNDVNLVVPVFVDGELFALLANTGHWMDIGGSVAGGWIPTATNIHEEGLLIPPVRLFEDGEPVASVIDVITGNVRLPDMIAGDLTAMSSALRRGEERLRGLVDRYGADVVRACQEEMIARSEREMRSYIAEIPDGVYVHADALDNDGVTDEPCGLRVAVTVSGSDLHLDFTGTSPAPAGPMNLARNTTVSSAYVALKHIFPDVPVNGGTFRPVTFTIPEGSVIAAQYPRPVSGYLEVVGRVIDLVFGALAPAIPDKVPAAFFGTTGVVTVSGHHPERGEYVVGVFPYPGGYGASASSDGQVHGTPPQSMANFMSIEVAEHRLPLRFDYYAMRDDSGGPGRTRGGVGSTYAFTAWSPLSTSVLGDRVDHVPFGVNGGGPASGNEVRFRTGGEEWVPPLRSKYQDLHLEPGDGVVVSSPGGGGFGDPLERPLEDVARDLDHGVVSRERAADVYGVVVAGVEGPARRPRHRLDEAGTKERREELRQRREADRGAGAARPEASEAVDSDGGQR